MSQNPATSGKTVASSGGALKSPWIWGFAGFIALALAVNLLAVYFAVSSSPGLVTKDYYERGQSFTERAKLSFVMRQKLGWRLDITPAPGASVGKRTEFTLNVTGVDGTNATVDSASFSAYRPSDATADFSTPMVKQADGSFRADVEFPLDGVWDIIITASQGDNQADTARRVIIKSR
ncbi:MAG: FixH family protein [Nitrospinae bacterium]|nr:FixH family protein [Nitrospinota bacterium]